MAGPRSAGTGAFLAFGAIWAGQLGGAVSVGLFDRISPEDLAWLRLVWASAVLVIFVRPWRHSWDRRSLLTCAGLGVASGSMTLLYMAAISSLPLGTEMALQFLGPLAVAGWRARKKGRLWCAMAFVGVLGLTEPWHSGFDLKGIALALAAGLCWAVYIVMTQRAGDNVSGLQALSMSLPVAALLATCSTGVYVVARVPLDVLMMSLGIGLLSPVVPFILELLALRRLTTTAFGVLMSLQPAVGAIVGFLMLAQVPRPLGVVGIVLVVIAGVGATRTGARSVEQSGARTSTRVFSDGSPSTSDRPVPPNPQR
ncbi:EamA family transporter [Arthrobacter globiformis]|uniref:EamA family transporter n=1 Tax=Arthrobacter globiformis TaxID=1665 RepID=UPI003978A046